MSSINCSACTDLQEYAPEFTQNGVTTNVAASLANDTGFNPSLAATHTDCDDLNDANDCLVGRMDQEIEAYEMCDWKEFMHKFIPNVYEVIKAIIASICGMWVKIHGLCNSIDAILGLIRGNTPSPIYGTWTTTGYNSLTPLPDWAEKSKYGIALRADIADGFGCRDGKRLGRWTVGITYKENTYPRIGSYSMTNYKVGDIWGYWRKSQVVPTYMTEHQWESIMRGYGDSFLMYSIFGPKNDSKILCLKVKGYIVIDGYVFNEELRDTYGEDTLVCMVDSVIGGNGDSSFTGIGEPAAAFGVKSYDA